MRVTGTAALIIIVVASLSAADSTVHTVAKGDTLYQIAIDYGISVAELVEANSISDASNLAIGTQLTIPTSYTVIKGDTLYSIALKHNTTVSVIAELNQLDVESGIIKVGDELRLPANFDNNNALTTVDSSIIAEEVESGQLETSGSVDSGQGIEIESGAELLVDLYWPHGGTRADKSGKVNGTEIIGKEGDIVYSVSSGTVVWSAPYRGYGKVVIVESIDSHHYLYGHLYGGSESVFVKVGDRVIAGTKLASLGNNPHTGEARLFFTVFKNGKFVDPEEAPRS